MSGVITAPEIREAWQYAELAYRSATDLSSLFGARLTVIDPMPPELGDACYLISEGERVVIVFPGSDDPLDWALNIDAREEHGLHVGFLAGLEALAEELLEHVGRLRPATILITGHSRGGALADMLLERYGHHLIDADIDCITFAQPRIATAGFYHLPCAKRLPSVRYLRVHTAADLVPHLPPSSMGWTHYGQALEIGPRQTRRQRLFQWWAGLRGVRAGRMITGDHRVEAYRTAVRGL